MGLHHNTADTITRANTMMVMITPDFWFGGAGGGGGITYSWSWMFSIFRHVDCECALTLRAVAVRTLADGQGFVRE